MITAARGEHYKLTRNNGSVLRGVVEAVNESALFLVSESGSIFLITRSEWDSALKVEKLTPVKFYGYYNRKMKTYFSCMTPDLKGVDLEICEDLTETKYLPEGSL